MIQVPFLTRLGTALGSFGQGAQQDLGLPRILFILSIHFNLNLDLYTKYPLSGLSWLYFLV